MNAVPTAPREGGVTAQHASIDRGAAPEAHLEFMGGRPWAQTRSGRAFPLVDPEPSDVHWPDIAYALAHINRFAGHAGRYSVAEHSIYVASAMPLGLEGYGLLHDAHEFVIGDFPTPAKWGMEHYARRWAGDTAARCVAAALIEMRAAIDKAIFGAAGLEWPIPADIKEKMHAADQAVLMAEVRDKLVTPPGPWGYEHIKPYPKSVELLSDMEPDTVAEVFLGALRLNAGRAVFKV